MLTSWGWVECVGCADRLDLFFAFLGQTLTRACLLALDPKNQWSDVGSLSSQIQARKSGLFNTDDPTECGSRLGNRIG